MKQSDFWKYFEEKIGPFKIDYQKWCYFLISKDKLMHRIGNVEPNDNLSGEDDPPGPVLRWYGNLSGIPVLLDFHQDHPNGEVVELHYGDLPDAIDAVRDYFVDWGDGWQESKLA